MTKRKIRTICTALCLCMLGLGLSGCGQTEEEKEETSVMGRVTAISDSEITLAVFEKPEGGQNEGAGPDGISGGAVGERPEPASGEAVQGDEKPTGTPPAGKSDHGAGEGKEDKFDQDSSETRKFTISSNTKVYTQQGEEESETEISDITPGTMVTIVPDGDEAAKITIQTMNGRQGNGEEKGRTQSKSS